MRYLALNTGPEFHALDHIAPLAEGLGMPLLVTEELSEDLARRYYPQVAVRFMPDLETRLSEIAEEFDVLFECKYWAPHLKAMFRDLYKKEMRLFFCPHGQSDKGFKTPLLAPYAWQDAVLLYGELLLQMLNELGISIPRFCFVGNYRLGFYLKHRSFYDGLVKREIPLDKTKRTLLYAPTWRDPDGAGSFFNWGVKVIQELPSDWNLIVKLHPLLEQRDPALFYAVSATLDKKPNAFLLHEFPLVYPLLSETDVYLGDASSVGYDFLYFQRPLFFFPSRHRGRLQEAGEIIDPDQNLYLQLERPKRDPGNLYELAFGPLSSEEELRERIKRTATCS